MTPRERVFELVMRRLDAMAPYKDGPAGARRARRRAIRPCWPAACCNLDRLGRWLLDAAGTTDGRLIDAVARRVLAAIYVRAFNVWLDDDTPDLARTLAELDRRLQQAESGWRAGSTGCAAVAASRAARPQPPERRRRLLSRYNDFQLAPRTLST